MIINADVLGWAADYDGPPFHAVLCDPPYELAFMGKHWDAAGVAFKPETWAAIARHVHPGGFIMAFGGSRTYHRLACAMEDAGLIIHPAVGWMFGSGFPKATRVKDTPDFDGHRYGLQALKPAFEFVCVAQVPYRGKPVESITATGAGAIWVDGGRVPTGDSIASNANRKGGPYSSDRTWSVSTTPAQHDKQEPAGRWPPNLALCHTPECECVGERRVKSAGLGRNNPNGPYTNDRTWNTSRTPGIDTRTDADADGLETIAEYRCAPGCPVAMVGAQSGELSSGNLRGETVTADNRVYGKAGSTLHRKLMVRDGDTGTAARFFPNPDWSLDIAERLAAADPALYCAKASRRERNAGCEGLEERRGREYRTGNVNKTRTDGGRTPDRAARNPHPTVKPLALTRWLATLLLPPDAYAPRRIAVPFAGSGTEAIGAMLAGWEEVVAVEREAEYADIARARMAWWEANRDKAPKVRAGSGEDWIAAGVRGSNRERGVYGDFSSDDGRHVRTNGHARPPAADAAPAPLPGFEAVG